jgi:hypothetical protein
MDLGLPFGGTNYMHIQDCGTENGAMCSFETLASIYNSMHVITLKTNSTCSPPREPHISDRQQAGVDRGLDRFSKVCYMIR